MSLAGCGYFDRLPNEIISIIADHVDGGPVRECELLPRDKKGRRLAYFHYQGQDGRGTVPKPMLKILRLTHRRFAHLETIKEVLFDDVELSAAPTCLASLQNGSFGRIASYIHAITFAPKPSWDVTRRGFEGIVSDLADQPISKEQLDEAWTSFQQIVRTSIKWLSDHDSELMTACIDALRLVRGHLRSIAFTTMACSQFPSITIPTPTAWEFPCRLGPHSRCDPLEESDDGREHGSHVEPCKLGNTKAADATLAAAVWCMAESDVAVERLSIQSHLSSTSRCSLASLPGWDRLDLSGLHALFFSPYWRAVTDEDFQAEEESDQEESMLRMGRIVQSIVVKSHKSLRYLHIGPRRTSGWESVPSLTWPNEGFPEMPSLQALRLHKCRFKLIRGFNLFTTWVSRMPLLEHLELYRPGDTSLPTLFGAAEPADWAWEPLFTAISDHPKVMDPRGEGMHVDFQTLKAKEGECFSYCRRIRRLRDEEDPKENDYNFDNSVSKRLDKMWLGRQVSRPLQMCLTGECPEECDCFTCRTCRTPRPEKCWCSTWPGNGNDDSEADEPEDGEAGGFEDWDDDSEADEPEDGDDDSEADESDDENDNSEADEADDGDDASWVPFTCPRYGKNTWQDQRRDEERLFRLGQMEKIRIRSRLPHSFWKMPSIF